ncbi:O-antigen ligase family protein [Pseudooceanicola onchidii]|uniref:O-antigen ligase family protein n=1 Tax=Pseudooceanicola onchidii TaxID=2562279 RepID=UPI0010AB1F04|nr:O-antigen ligase family protein [Pseudooceanicola onchidii]
MRAKRNEVSVVAADQTRGKGWYGRLGGERLSPIKVQKSRLPLMIFLLCLFMPFLREVGGLALTPTRLFLLATMLPFLYKLVSGQIGRFTWVDGFMLLHGLWVFVALIAVHGTERIPFAGITVVELVGGYFAGRVLVRDAEDYRWFLRFIFVVLLCLAPLVLIESLTGKLIIPDFFRGIFDTPTRDRSARGRMGMERVQMVFDHPILWGLFCVTMLANFVMLLHGRGVLRWFAAIFVLWLTMTSLSSGPLLACFLSLFLLAWNWIMKGRWKLLIILSIILYVGVDMASNRTPVTILISNLTFNSLSAWTRIAQFDAGMESVRNNPLFGIGFNEMPRPSWVNASIDNFWLVSAVRYGVIAVVSVMLAFISHLWLASRLTISNLDTNRLRIGHLIAFSTHFFVLATVHVWSAVGVFIMFYMGAGAWLYTSQLDIDPDMPDPEEEGPQQATSPYSRFVQTPNPGRGRPDLGGAARADALQTARGLSSSYSRGWNETQERLGLVRRRAAKQGPGRK